MTEPTPRGTGLRSYLVSENYADTVAHGLFHFTVIMLAFIIGNVWASHDAELRDLRGQYAVLIPLKQELETFQARALADEANPPMPETQQGQSSAGGYGTQPTPCQNGFLLEYARNTTGWQSIRQEDRYFLLADWTFYEKLDNVYKTAANEPDVASRVTTREECRETWAQFDQMLIVFNKEMNVHLVDLQDQYAGPWWRWPISKHHLRILLYTLVGLVIVLALPVLLRAGEHSLRRWSVFKSLDDVAVPSERIAESGASSGAAAASGAGPRAGTSDPEATAAGGATTIGSR